MYFSQNTLFNQCFFESIHSSGMVSVFQSCLMIEKEGEKPKPRNTVGFAPKSTVLSQFCLGKACDSLIQRGQSINFEASDRAVK